MLAPLAVIASRILRFTRTVAEAVSLLEQVVPWTSLRQRRTAVRTAQSALAAAALLSSGRRPRAQDIPTVSGYRPQRPGAYITRLRVDVGEVSPGNYMPTTIWVVTSRVPTLGELREEALAQIRAIRRRVRNYRPGPIRSILVESIFREAR